MKIKESTGFRKILKTGNSANGWKAQEIGRLLEIVFGVVQFQFGFPIILLIQELMFMAVWMKLSVILACAQPIFIGLLLIN